MLETLPKQKPNFTRTLTEHKFKICLDERRKYKKVVGKKRWSTRALAVRPLLSTFIFSIQAI